MRRNLLVGFAVLCGVSLSLAQFHSAEPPLADPQTAPSPANPKSVVELRPQYVPPSLNTSRSEIAVTPAPDELPPELIPAQHIQPATGSDTLPAQNIRPQPWNAPIGKTPARTYAEPPTPTVKISVRGLDIAAINQELSYRLIVSNTSEAKAHHVTVRCPLPKGATFVRSVPEAKPTEAKAIEWHLETLEPGSSRQMDVVFKPALETDELTVIGVVQFDHGRYVKTRIAPPSLNVRKTGPAQALVGEPATYRIEITNNGKVPAQEIEVVDTLPAGLEYLQESATGAKAVSRDGLAAHQRAWSVGTLLPAQKRTIEYRAMPRKIGQWESYCHVTATDVKQIEAKCATSIVDAKLTLQVDGPGQTESKVGVSVPYRITIYNTGTATLNNIRVECNFPQEIRLARASKGGQFFKDAVQWIIPNLAPKDTKELTLALIAPSSGERQIKVAAKADRGLEQRQMIKTNFDGIEALNWTVEGTAVGSVGHEVVYTIAVNNPGSGPARNVKVTADLPSQIELSKAEPAFQRDAKNNSLYFNPVEIPPKQMITIKIVGIARRSGEARFNFELRADGVGTGPLRKTPSTQIAPSSRPEAKKNVENIGGIAPQKEAIPVSNPAKKVELELPPKKKDLPPTLLDPLALPPEPIAPKKDALKPVSADTPKKEPAPKSKEEIKKPEPEPGLLIPVP